MNCFSRRDIRIRWLACLLVFVSLVPACGAPASEPAEPTNGKVYRLDYDVTINADAQTVDVRLTLRQSRYLLREMSFDTDRIASVDGDGELEIENGRATWLPPENGGVLSWQVFVPHERNGSGFDAWLDNDWGLFRAEDIIPRAATRTLKGATADASLSFALPQSWSAVTEYAKKDERFPVRKAERRFDQPSGWIVVGELGVRRERVAGVRVAVAAPNGESVRRLDMLAMLNWTLPELARIVPAMPPRLTIVSAGEPMWRGGLSAPQSIYIHKDRPLISENGTSTLMHELMHVTIGRVAAPGHDWVVEGFAEYYALRLLHQSGTLSPARFERAIEDQREWSKSADKLCGPRSQASTTALAVIRLHALDAEIRKATDEASTLDDVLQVLLVEETPLELETLRNAATSVMGKNPDALHIDKLPGCHTLAADSTRP